MRRERRLGQGLAGLLGGNDESDSIASPAADAVEVIDVVDPPAPDVVKPPAPTSPTQAAAGTARPVESMAPIAPTASAAPVGKAPIMNGANPNASTQGVALESPEDLLDEGSSTSRELLLSINLIEVNPFQPRREFLEAEIAALSESLKDHDMLQPVLVRRLGTKYQLISGERRLRAAKLAGWKKIPAKIRDADDRLVTELAIIENLQRKDLSPIEKALAYQRYLDEHDCRQEDLAGRLKVSRSQIANLLRLLELPTEVRRELQAGSITAGHARALLPLGDRRQQIKFCKLITIDGLSVRAIEQLVSETVGRDDAGKGRRAKSIGKGKARTTDRQIASLEKELRRALGTKVEIKTGSGGSGKISLHFKNHDEFERIRDLLSG